MKYMACLLSGENSLEDFLHYSKKSLINSYSLKYEIIKNFKFFLELSRTSIVEFFYNDRYELFDGQVSENLCQIRGYMTLMLSYCKKEIMKCYPLKLLDENISNAIQSLEELLDALDQNKIKNRDFTILKTSTLSFEEFMSLLKIEIKLPNWLYYLAVSYFLQTYNLKNEEGVSLAIDYKRLCQELCLSKNFARSVIHNLQKKISELSTNFIMQLILTADICKKKYYYLSHFIKIDDDGRTVLPCYAVMDAILTDANKKNIYLAIVIKRYQMNQYKDSILMTYKSSKKGFYSIYFREDIVNENTLIIEGKVNYECVGKIESVNAYIQRFNRFDVSTVIMSNMAKHPQYSGVKLIPYKENPYIKIYQNMLLSDHAIYKKEIELFINEFNSDKWIAIKEGFWKENHKTFLAMHIYCATIQHLLGKFNDLYVPLLVGNAEMTKKYEKHIS